MALYAGGYFQYFSRRTWELLRKLRGSIPQPASRNRKVKAKHVAHGIVDLTNIRKDFNNESSKKVSYELKTKLHNLLSSLLDIYPRS